MNITRLTRSQYVWRIGVLRFGLAIGLVDAVFEYVRTYGWTGHGFSPPSGLVIVAARFVFSSHGGTRVAISFPQPGTSKRTNPSSPPALD